MIGVRGLLAALLCAWAMPAIGADDPAVVAAYDRSAQLLPWNKPGLIENDDIHATWIDGGRLWFKRTTSGVWHFVIADVARDATRPAFDHAAMAAALSTALGRPVSERQLPLAGLDLVGRADGSIGVTVAGTRYRCDLVARACHAEPEQQAKAPDRAYGPHGRFAVFRRGENLWRVDLASGEERALTSDGVPDRGYGGIAGAAAPISRRRLGMPDAPIGYFSPDGTKFLTYRLDERAAPAVTLIETVPAPPLSRPRALTYRSSYPGDPPATAQLMILDLISGAAVTLAHPPTVPAQRAPIALDQVRWSADSRHVYFIDYADLFRARALFRADVATGRTDALIVEQAKTSQYQYAAPEWQLLANGEIVWPSERSGWWQLDRHDRTGRLRNAITRGHFAVRGVIDVDEAAGSLTFSAGGREPGRDPYLRHIYRVGLDGHGLRLLTPEDADHEVRVGGPQYVGVVPVDLPSGFAPDRRHFIDSFSRVDLPTRTVVRRAGGGIAMTLAVAGRVAGAPAFPLPERFSVIAADGRTPVYGVIFKPKDFDPTRRYPVIDSMYGGPQAVYVPKTFGRDLLGHYGRGLAELGSIVVVIDGRGTPFRSRAFLDAGYGHLGKAGFLEDHIAALRQLAATRPWMDLTRVGAFGYSGGGFAVVHAMLDHPDFYSVGVASSTYDPALSSWPWAAQFQGAATAAALVPEASYRNAAQLRGKLLLLHGDLDDVAEWSGTMRIADALIRHDKSFDLVIIPGGDHNVTVHPYGVRRQWDYFAQHLIGLTPPANYRFGPTAPAH